MIELTNLDGEVFTINPETIHIFNNPETIHIFKTEETGSKLETTDGTVFHVKEDILTIMQRILNDKFEGGKN